MAKILKYPGCNQEIRTSKTRDLNKHMNLNGNLCKGQCQPALLIMQNVENVTLEQNTPQTENVTPEQNLLSTPEANNRETIMEAYKRINDESEAIAKKTNSRIDMRKSGNYTLTTIKFFKETTLAPQKSEKISKQESA
ncbi:2641_t:CDS:2 [Dentiscutata heterogama]|uniref:2641_t:CDS:1 n=1 Tax=Dentiscutata heterogama TaxID=1316150 RepID=A0ACA9NGI8_9GLOM|nr:2641_t:CDS:2 [Dentiscutata heterogama]